MPQKACFGRHTSFTVRLEHIKGVKLPGKYVQVGFHSCCAQILHKALRLTVKGLRVADEGVTGRQVPVIGLPGGRGVGTELLPVLPREVFGPGAMIFRRVPDRRVIVARGGRVAVVEHRIERHLKGDVHLAAVTREHAQRRRQSAAGAFAAHHDLIAAHAELLRVLLEPQQRRVAVIQRGGVGRLAGEAVFRSDDDGMKIPHQIRRPREKRHFRHTAPVSAAVDP